MSHVKKVKKEHQFSKGYNPEEHSLGFNEWVDGHQKWLKSGEKPTQAQLRHLERSSVELGAPIPARFKHLQHLNK